MGKTHAIGAIGAIGNEWNEPSLLKGTQHVFFWGVIPCPICLSITRQLVFGPRGIGVYTKISGSSASRRRGFAGLCVGGCDSRRETRSWHVVIFAWPTCFFFRPGCGSDASLLGVLGAARNERARVTQVENGSIYQGAFERPPFARGTNPWRWRSDGLGFRMRFRMLQVGVPGVGSLSGWVPGGIRGTGHGAELRCKRAASLCKSDGDRATLLACFAPAPSKADVQIILRPLRHRAYKKSNHWLLPLFLWQLASDPRTPPRP